MNSLEKYMNDKKKKRIYYLVIIILFGVFLGYRVNFSMTRLIKGIPSMMDLFKRMLKPNLSYRTEVFGKLFETIEIAILSSLMGVLLAIPFSILTSNNISPSKWISNILTGIFSFLRTIPSLIWAAILVSIFSIGKFSGIIALSIIAFLMSSKLFRENIESIKENQINSTRSVGASPVQVLRYCVFPYMFEMTISIFFIVFETNIRSATVLGLVGAGGIGQIMWRDLNHLRYDNLATLILILFITIFLIDTFSLILRNRLKGSSMKFKDINNYKNYQVGKSIFIPVFVIGLLIFIINSIGISLDRLLLGLGQGKIILMRMIDIDISYYPNLLQGISESLFIALFATIVGSIIAIIISYLTAFNTSPRKEISIFFKALINIFRTFPPIITAIIFFRGVGPGPLAGAMALSIYTTGVLTKMYSEVLENTEENIKNSVLITGASNIESYRHGLIPHTLPNFLSLSLYRLESNIRNSTILGLIGAGGIGTTLSMNITWRNWERVGLLLLGTSLMVILIDQFSNFLRRIFK